MRTSFTGSDTSSKPVARSNLAGLELFHETQRFSIAYLVANSVWQYYNSDRISAADLAVRELTHRICKFPIIVVFKFVSFLGPSGATFFLGIT